MSGTFFVRTASPTSTISPPELSRSSSLSSDAMNLRISASTCAGGEVERACDGTYSQTIEDSRAQTIRTDARRVGKECVRTCRSRVWPDRSQQKIQNKNTNNQ